MARRKGLGGGLPHPARRRAACRHAGGALRRPPHRRRGHPPLPAGLRAERHHRPGLRPRRGRAPDAGFVPTSSWRTPAGGSAPSSRTSGRRPARCPTSSGTTTGRSPTAPPTTPRPPTRSTPAPATGCATRPSGPTSPPPTGRSARPASRRRSSRAWMRERLTVMHDGVDTELHSPGDGAGDPRPLGGAAGRRGPDLDHPRHGAAPRLPRDDARDRAPAKAPAAAARADRRRGPGRLRRGAAEGRELEGPHARRARARPRAHPLHRAPQPAATWWR